MTVVATSCLILHSFDLLKNQSVCTNLRILYRLTMDLCCQLKARRFVLTSHEQVVVLTGRPGVSLFASVQGAVLTVSVNVQETKLSPEVKLTASLIKE